MRGLEREIGAVCRHVAMRLAEGEDVHLKATPQLVETVLGPARHLPDLAERVSAPGVATGLAWTPSGGDVLFIEATKMPGKGQLAITGNLKSVMQESASTAVSFVRSKAPQLKLDPEFQKTIDLHLHVPKGATPKDGPSAGITMFVAVASLLLGAAVRKDVAMTGEITLRGNVLPVGGIKEKLLAAHRAGITEVLVPARNERDLDDLPKDVREQLKIQLVKRVDEDLPLVLEPPTAAAPVGADQGSSSVPPPPRPARTAFTFDRVNSLLRFGPQRVAAVFASVSPWPSASLPSSGGRGTSTRLPRGSSCLRRLRSPRRSTWRARRRGRHRWRRWGAELPVASRSRPSGSRRRCCTESSSGSATSAAERAGTR